MAAGSHVRSISWPDNVHPLTRTIEYHLLTLTTTTTTTQLPQSSMYQKLGVLKNLYEVVEDFLRLPLTRESPTDLEHVSDGFLQVLDICSTARDVILQTKEHIRDLESAIRRRSKSGGGGGGGEKDLAREIDAFVSRRRAMNRTVSRYARPPAATKRTEKKERCSRKDVLREVQEVSFGVLFGLLMFLSAGSDQKQRWRRKNWNIVISKMFHSNYKSSNASESEVLGVTEAELEGMKKSGTGVVYGEELQRLREMEMKVEEIEGELEIVYRMLVRTRVSLLNILNSNI